jgi:VIT1/CCC1 family predicted Fe2+/Mn2+ transporter
MMERPGKMNNGLKILIYVLLAAFVLVVLKFLIKVSLLIAAVIAVVLLLGLVVKQKAR